MSQPDDPLVMYLVVRSDLGMSPGKIAAQVGHGVQLALQNLLSTVFSLDRIPAEEPIFDTVAAWLAAGYRKVVLAANGNEWVRLKELAPAAVVRDEGHTEVEPGSETVLAFWPMRKSERPPLLKRLRVL